MSKHKHLDQKKRVLGSDVRTKQQLKSRFYSLPYFAMRIVLCYMR